MITNLRLNIDEYEQMITSGAFDHLSRRIELIHGEMLQMSPAGPTHYDYIDFLNRWSFHSLPKNFASIHIQGAVLIDDSLPEPDLAWLRYGRYADRRPTPSDVLLVVEVAQSSLAFDLGTKAALYSSGGIAEYWVIDIEGTQIHRHRQPTVDGYGEIQIFGASKKMSPICCHEAVLVLRELFI